MQTKTAVCVLLIAEGLGQETLWGQTRPRPAVRTQVVRANVTATSASATRASAPAKTKKNKPQPATSRTLLALNRTQPPARSTSNASNVAPSYLLRSPAPQDTAAGLHMHRLLPYYTWEKTPFNTQVRVPLADFWDGRIQVACFHQRTRGAEFYSAVPRSEMASIALPSNVVTPAQRSYESYGGGVWFRLGRNREAQTAARQTSGAPVR